PAGGDECPGGAEHQTGGRLWTSRLARCGFDRTLGRLDWAPRRLDRTSCGLDRATGRLDRATRLLHRATRGLHRATRRLDLVARGLGWIGITTLGGVPLAGASAHRPLGWTEHQAGKGAVRFPPRRMIRTLPFAGSWGSERRTRQHRTEHHEDRAEDGEQPRPHTQTCRPTIQYIQPA